VVGKRLDSYRALVELQKLGITKHIGVSNFNINHLEELRAAGLPPPTVNQIEVHPFLQRRELTSYCQSRGITVVAYSPLAKGKVFQNKTVLDIAREVGVSPAQVLLRWGLQKGYVVLPKSTHEERQRVNITLASFELSAEAMGRLDSLDEGLVTGWDPTKWD
jgi:diketogulonate reductase-like aldo/keto reductase